MCNVSHSLSELRIASSTAIGPTTVDSQAAVFKKVVARCAVSGNMIDCGIYQLLSEDARPKKKAKMEEGRAAPTP